MRFLLAIVGITLPLILMSKVNASDWQILQTLKHKGEILNILTPLLLINTQGKRIKKINCSTLWYLTNQ